MRDQEEDRISWISQSKGITREEVLQALERVRDEPSYRSELEQMIAMYGHGGTGTGTSTKRKAL